MSTVEVFICFLNFWWVIRFLTQLVWPCLLNYAKRTSCEFKLDQNPVESARKVKTWPESLIRIPKQTSASHILLYSYAFFLRPLFRRSFICRIDFLRDVEALRIFGLSEVFCRHLNSLLNNIIHQFLLQQQLGWRLGARRSSTNFSRGLWSLLSYLLGRRLHRSGCSITIDRLLINSRTGESLQVVNLDEVVRERVDRVHDSIISTPSQIPLDVQAGHSTRVHHVQLK